MYNKSTHFYDVTSNLHIIKIFISNLHINMRFIRNRHIDILCNLCINNQHITMILQIIHIALSDLLVSYTLMSY